MFGLLVSDLFLACRWLLSCYILTGRKKSSSDFSSCSYKTPIPSWDSNLLTISKPNYLPKVPPPPSTIMRVRASTYEVWGNTRVTNIQSITTDIFFFPLKLLFPIFLKSRPYPTLLLHYPLFVNPLGFDFFLPTTFTRITKNHQFPPNY